MTNLDKIDQEITDILLEHLVLANDNGQPYIQYTDVAVDKIITLIATQIQEARINELKNLLADDGQCICQLANQKVCDHNWSLCNTVKDRIAQLRSTPNEDMDN